MMLWQLAKKLGVPTEILIEQARNRGLVLTEESLVTVEILTALVAEKKGLLAQKATDTVMEKPLPTKPFQGTGEKRTVSPETASLVQNHCVLVDSTALLSPGWDGFLENIRPLLKPGTKKLFLPLPVLEDLQAEKSQGERLARLASLNREQLVSVRGRQLEEGSTAAQELLTICAALKMVTSLLVVSADQALAADLLQLNNQPSAVGKQIYVKQITPTGLLEDVPLLEIPPVLEEVPVVEAEPVEAVAAMEPVQMPEEDSTPVPAEADLLREDTPVTSLSDTPDQILPVTTLPTEGDTVYMATQEVPISLTKKIAQGGEGTIYETDGGMVAKIYRQECVTLYRRQKLELLIERKLDCGGICSPKSLLCNTQGEFVGYLMEKAEGVTLRSGIFRREAFVSHFPTWKREDLVQLGLTILEKIRYLHTQGILLGDVNPGNILVQAPTEVWLVDVDSCQIGAYPCPVGDALYTAPELHKRIMDGEIGGYADTLRDMYHERFAIGVLLFQLLMGGQYPYAQTDSAGMVEDMLTMRLPYPLGDAVPPGNIPEGPWRFLWSNLTFAMKKNFHTVFHHTEEMSPWNREERLTVEKWIKELEIYRHTLRKWQKELDEFCVRKQCTVADVVENRVHHCPVDPQTLEVGATRLKRMKHVVYGNCTTCGKEHAVSFLRGGQCRECSQKAKEPVAVAEMPVEAQPVEQSVAAVVPETPVSTASVVAETVVPVEKPKPVIAVSTPKPTATPVKTTFQQNTEKTPPKQKKTGLSLLQKMKNRIVAVVDGMYEI